jgi:hypothetical protein
MAGERFVNMINWTRSTRYYLVLKRSRFGDDIKKLKFYYPDGCLFKVYSHDEI